MLPSNTSCMSISCRLSLLLFTDDFDVELMLFRFHSNAIIASLPRRLHCCPLFPRIFVFFCRSPVARNFFPYCLSTKQISCWRCRCSGIKSSFASVVMQLLHPFLADFIVSPFCRALFPLSCSACPCHFSVSLVVSLCCLLNPPFDACRFQFPCSSSPEYLFQALLMLNEQVDLFFDFFVYARPFCRRHP